MAAIGSNWDDVWNDVWNDVWTTDAPATYVPAPLLFTSPERSATFDPSPDRAEAFTSPDRAQTFTSPARAS